MIGATSLEKVTGPAGAAAPADIVSVTVSAIPGTSGLPVTPGTITR